MIRKKAVSFKEGKQLFNDNGFYSLRDERSDCNRAIVRRIRFVPFLGIGKTLWLKLRHSAVLKRTNKTESIN